ncbi:protein S40-4 [Mercurialis annua]|uniref:protein S40-4 n=1 Tax=Mercurialis annua TaxID=3986 RepID=UPI00215EC20E|nr:protein S40-4 [Mercurialis annua]XP_050212966.1 protein S40-4 [Mercurialis annua]
MAGNEDFEEGDIWSVVRDDSSPNTRKMKDKSSSFSNSSAWRLHSTPRMIPRANIITTNQPTSSLTATTYEVKGVEQASAPVCIPDWSKIYGKDSRMGSRGSSKNDQDDDGNYVKGNGYYGHYENDGDDEEDGGIVPPHEWIAKKLARSQISSFSVCEGIGRTLKGRDLSKVRNAILTKTGFLE